MAVSRNLDIKALRSFTLAHKLGSFSAAAEALHCSQAALSLRIKKLEEGLGAQLFHRNYHLLSLTRAGERYLADAERVLRAHDHMLRRAQDHAEREVIRLGVPEDFARPLFGEFMARHGQLHDRYDIELSMRLCRELIDLVQEGELDMTIVTLFSGEPLGELVATRRVHWVCAPDFDYQSGEPLPLALYSERCIYRNYVLPILDAMGWPYRISFSAQGASSVQAAVNAGMGLTVIAEGMIPPGLVVAPANWNLPTLGSTEVRMIKGRHLSPAALAFADALMQTFSMS